ncbi:hypothetical protein Taro_003206 [Colocasia esculenta]|uniref:Uncharacterized protein n=1 Tax=Colocasia esculenta TaxID=4460 RepID=A0A843TMZ9_COLES|nr:hypothetical protein [Colocasia esculenta]
MIIYLTNDLCVYFSGTNIYCKGGVDTPHTGVDTMFQALRQKMKKWSTSVDTRPGQVDTRDRSQRNILTGFYLRSTRDDIRSTLESLPRRPVFQMAKAGRHEMISGRHYMPLPGNCFAQSGTVCRHTSWAGRHTPESL